MADKLDDEGRPAAAQPSAKGLRTIASRDIFGEDKLVLITHENETYRLQRTTAGKLILTK